MGIMRDRRNPAGMKDETEALQTDVMRFLAIICMCLMIIFALVQSLPGPDTSTKQASESAAQVVQNEHNAAQKIQDAEQKVQESERKVQQTEQKVQRTVQKAQQAEQKMKQAEQKTQELTDLSHSLDQQIKNKKQALARLEKKIEKSRKHPSENQPPVKPGKQQGFSLAFSSDKDFRHLLVTRENMDLYLFAEKNCWKLFPGVRGRYKFQVSGPPVRVYDMDPATVPSDIEQAAAGITSVYKKDNVTYGVSLPGEIQQIIKGIMAQRKGGHLVIDRNGHVSIKETGQ